MTPKERAKTLCSLIRSYGGTATPADEELIAETMRIGERDARAAGYAEALKQAAALCDSRVHAWDGATPGERTANCFGAREDEAAFIGRCIRALAPATTKEPK